ncbi:MAG TPA: hypothetical protein VFW28_11775 [Micropepsaceae bacterium]|nr:hypothetical protein [Micropepsaceae bacterium]
MPNPPLDRGRILCGRSENEMVEVAERVEFPDGWSDIGSLPLNTLESFENQWDKFRRAFCE